MGIIQNQTEPHYHSIHGRFRLIVTLDGEDVRDCELAIGYLHRGIKKLLRTTELINK